MFSSVSVPHILANTQKLCIVKQQWTQNSVTRTLTSTNCSKISQNSNRSDNFKSSHLNISTQLPSHSQVVIAGAGTVANSVAYHLVINGWRDVVILEQNRIGSGTSHFGSGTIGLFKPIAHRNLISYSLKLYQHLQSSGYNLQLHQCGSINLAQTKDRMIALRRRMAYNVPTGLHCEILTKDDIKRLHPYIYVDDLEGGVWVPDDAVADPQAICNALAHISQQNGARYIENCRINRVLTSNERVKTVETDLGSVSCEYFVNCAGMWARELGLRCSPPVRIPASPAEHFYVVTKGLESKMSKELLPCVRDFDSFAYMRDWQGEMMTGWFEPEARPAFEGRGVPGGDWKRELTADEKHWRPMWNQVMRRIPLLGEAKELDVINCPDNFTPDGRWILGESPEVKGYFVAVGMNGNSLQGAGGIGKEVAEWLMNGETTHELLPFNIQRFLDLHNNRQYLQQRIREVVGRNYAILYPHQCEYKYARKLRCSPLYSVLEDRGAIFGIKMAYERPLYFDSTYKRGQRRPTMPSGSFYKPQFFEFMKEEFQACREAVGIIDMSSFCKIAIKSAGSSASASLSYLQRLCSNDADIPIGSITRTAMLNERGGYENDCMLVRQSKNNYFMVSPTSQQTRIFQWMSRHLPLDHSVRLTDLTSSYTVINVVGPKGPELLSELSNSDVNLSPFTYKAMNVGYASDVMVMAFTHTGEPGYCLYVPSEYALHVYSKLMELGKDYGARNVGVLTQRFMRIERFIPFWAEELTPFVTPFEAGCHYSVKLEKSNFIGKGALEAQKREGVGRRLVLFVLEGLEVDKEVWAWGGEPIYRNGEFVGSVTSAGYGFAVEKLVGLGFIGRPRKKGDNRDERQVVTVDFIMDSGAKYEIDIAGRRFQVRPNIHAISAPVWSSKKYMPTLVGGNSAGKK